MNVTYDYWTDDARAIQKIVDGEADAYFTALVRFLGYCERSKTRTAGYIWCRSRTTAGFRTCTCPRR